MGSEINPYEISKDLMKRILSLRFQNYLIVSILFFALFKKLFEIDFKICINTILSYFPNSFKTNVHNIILPFLKLLLFISSIGGISLIVLLLIFAVNEKWNIFRALIHNYMRYFRGENVGVFDNFVVKLIVKPFNITFIILGLCYLVGDSEILNNYFRNLQNLENQQSSIREVLTLLQFSPFFFIMAYYILLPIIFIFKKIED